jgi:predicted nucleotidyltransferase
MKNKTIEKIYPYIKTHDERIDFINKLLKLITGKYKEEIESVILYGSVSRNEDDRFSDVELTVIMKTPNFKKVYEGIYDGHKYQTIMIGKNLAYEDIEEIDLVWPLRLGTYLDGKVIYGNEDMIGDFQECFNKVIMLDFNRYLKKEFVNHIYETFCKFFNSSEKNDTVKMYALADYLFWKVVSFVGLINKHQYKTTLTRVQDSLELEQNFPSFQVWGRKFVKGETYSVNELKDAVSNLYAEFMDYFEGNNIVIHDDELQY